MFFSIIQGEKKRIFNDDRPYSLMKTGRADICLYLSDLSFTVKPLSLLVNPIGETYSYICANDSTFGDPEVAKIQWVERREDIQCELLKVSQGFVDDYINMNELKFGWGVAPDLKGNFPGEIDFDLRI